MESGYGVDVRLLSCLTSSSPTRTKHTSYCPISPIRKSALSASSKLRSRHCSEPAKGLMLNILNRDYLREDTNLGHCSYIMQFNYINPLPFKFSSFNYLFVSI